MNYSEIVNTVIADAESWLELFRPELALIGTILIVLVLRVPDFTRKWLPTWLVALAGSGLALWWTAPWLLGTGSIERTEIFTGMLIYDSFTVFLRALLIFFTILFIVLTRISGIPDSEDAADFYCLVLGSVLGMCLMASANHLLILFLAVEMASVPSYVLAGLFKGRKLASEAALKYSVYGAGTAGIMLYGISLIAGVVGTAHFPTIAMRLPEAAATAPMVLLLGGLMIMVGLAFKLSAVPFHFWCPDVFEGASAEVNAFLSVASKAAALALLVRVTVGLSTGPDLVEPPDAVAVAGTIESEQTVQAMAPASAVDNAAGLSGIRRFLSYLVAVIAAITCTFGNLAAYGQTNIKRLLAYSTIAHAGYMMMPVAAGLRLIDVNTVAAEHAFASLLVYAGIYLFMNLGAFAIVAFLRNTLFSEEIADYAGLIKSSPGVVVCFTAILFSLIGLPPLAGFLAKFVIFAGLVEAEMYTLLFIGGINTAISLFYYLRVVKVMTFEPEPLDRAPVRFSMLSIPGIYVALITAPVFLLIVQWSGLHNWSLAACQQLIGN